MNNSFTHYKWVLLVTRQVPGMVLDSAVCHIRDLDMVSTTAHMGAQDKTWKRSIFPKSEAAINTNSWIAVATVFIYKV